MPNDNPFKIPYLLEGHGIFRPYHKDVVCIYWTLHRIFLKPTTTVHPSVYVLRCDTYLQQSTTKHVTIQLSNAVKTEETIWHERYTDKVYKIVIDVAVSLCGLQACS